MLQATAAPLYRVKQFFQAVTARVTPEDLAVVDRHLPPAARALFRRQTRADRRHALAVYRLLRRAGHDDPHLLAAALLHDVGKSVARVPLVYRVAWVLLGRCCPRLLDSLSRGDHPPAWRRPFVAHARHPEIGAEQARQAGCSPLTVALIRRHHEPGVDTSPPETDEARLLAALQAADDLS